MTKDEADRAVAAFNEKLRAEVRSLFRLPWKRGVSSSDGEPIYTADDKLIMHVYSTAGDQHLDEKLADWIIGAVNSQPAEAPH